MSARLQQLAALKGVAAQYHDVWGHEHAVADDTLRAILVAMRVLDAADASEAAVEAALARHAEQRRASPLPPVAVLFDDDDAWRLPLRLPAGAGTLGWQLVEEGGATHEGTLDATALAEADPGAFADAALADHWTDARVWPLPLRAPLGYHALSLLRDGQVVARCALISAPRTIFVAPALQGEARLWGAAAQLYSMRSRRNWGIGDFADLQSLVELWGRQGAGVVGVNPLHAMFPHNPAHSSPYSPSSRLFLNVQYLAVEAIDDYEECPDAQEIVNSTAFQGRLDALRDTELVDYVGVAEAKRPVLERLYAHFREAHLARGSERARAFDAFRAARGEALRRHALFEALQAQLHAADPAVWGWPVWPERYRDPASPAVAEFEHEQLAAVEFYEYLQWQADLQLAAVGRRSLELGLGVGLYTDLAVSIDRAGAEAWSEQALYALDASVGAPPDELNLKGQNWGLPPIDPVRLRDAAYAPFIATLRANMAHAGALRIDHVMALMRLYWIAADGDARTGAYVHYPFDDLLGIVALESRRNRCLVIGEDLGTVPDEVRHKLAAAGVLSYKVLFFERRDGSADYKLPGELERQALVVAATHDLATLAGWWSGHDLEMRTRLELFPTAQQREQALLERVQDRARLLLALDREQLLPAGVTTDPLSMPAMTDAFMRALHRLLARSPSMLAVVQLEDVLLTQEQANLPGTTDQHPNWRRKLALPLEQWATDEHFAELVRALQRERPRTALAPGAATSAHAAPASVVIPRATYRVQLHKDFRFADATALVPYLAELGISHLYCSPFLRARPGSMHGYDVVDHNRINPEIGTREELQRLADTLRAHGMGGLLSDVVPNHMGVLGGENAWWHDVLEHGQASMHADYFDIDWQAADPALAGRVLLPILGDQYGVVLERGELKLEFDADSGRFALVYYEHRLPVDPASTAGLLERASRAVPPGALPPYAVGALAGLMAAFGRLPPHRRGDAAARAERRRDAPLLQQQLARLAQEHAPLAQAIGQVVTAVNGQPSDRDSFAALDALIDAQPYRLAFWRVAGDEINYRRFFDINELAALRQEVPEVFEATHRLIFDLVAEGVVDGLRIDHPDGLLDPAGYFRHLQQQAAARRGIADADETRPLYVVVEKIVAPHEQVPADWPVYGTTGYRYANVVNGLFVDADAKGRLDRAWRAFARDEAEDFEELSYHCRRIVLATAMSGELTVLSNRLLRLARADRRTRDFTFGALRHALAEVVASFPVYRTYIIDQASAQDRRFIDWAVGRARRRSRAGDASVFDLLRRVLLGRPLPGAPAELAEGYRAFARRLQQFTSPVAAKGIEDTALYRHQRLISINDVGGEPDAFGTTVAAFHAASRDRATNWPHTMLATSTHDAKRSEDVRARVDVISEMPGAWRLTARRWSRLNRSRKRTVEGRPAPSRNDEYLLYQTLIGSVPTGELDAAALKAYADRIEQYMLKAARESKARTSWVNPNPAYEAALSQYVHALLDRRDGNLFLDDLLEVRSVFDWYGALNGLAVAALKFTSPGVPDLYQGHELIELSLVDPDNRRPVDYEARRRLLGAMRADFDAGRGGERLREWIGSAPDGRAKMWISWRALQLRREHEALFRDGDYLPLTIAGSRERHAVAYARRQGGRWVVVASGRLFASMELAVGAPPLGEAWADTRVELPADALAGWTDALTGARREPRDGTLRLADLFVDAPVALLVGG